ncbi:HNH endonuclease [Pseudomonas gingeri]|uniref:HNH endonuclease n=1 Tax=Pseudomonas gingeri TaxID=117681 RepID=A0A7Y8C3L7_9PSED|nr:HNH endonuclease signature motif containing protein [Pseudomonas gingeri]NWB98358.1 HNH endonuclease [Pseudomonas gingeri]
MKIGFRWLDGDLAGSVELFELADLSWPATDKTISHSVRRTDEKSASQAKCKVSVSGNVVELDYAAFPKENIAKGMLLGTTRLTTRSAPDFRIVTVEWKPQGSQVFELERFEFVVPRQRTASFRETEVRLEQEVEQALKKSFSELEQFLPPDGYLPPKIKVVREAFVRNPYVIAVRLTLAKGKCDLCKQNAPFKNKENKPYLEVHHITHLANGGSDTLANTQALCPNCHRKLHFGGDS